MRTVINRHKTEYFDSRLFNTYFGGFPFCVFDIETTGLNPSYCRVILAAFLYVYPDGSCVVKQYFIDDTDEERDLLIKIRDELSSCEMVITYNGRHFDIPFIEKRAAKYGLTSFIRDLFDFDLYPVLGRFSGIGTVTGSLSQKSVEAYLGFSDSRADEISGKESVELFDRYLSADISESERASAADRILLHNHDDVLQLYKLLPVIFQTDFHRAVSNLGFPVRPGFGWPVLNIENIKLNLSSLTVRGTYSRRPLKNVPAENVPACSSPDASGSEIRTLSFISFGDWESPVSAEFRKDAGFTLSVPTESVGKSIFFNVMDFFKSVSEFEDLPGYVNGCLILSDNGDFDHRAINSLAVSLINHFAAHNSCPDA